jgi:hypothetical protein
MYQWWPEATFKTAVAENISVSGVLRQLGVTVSGWNYRRVKMLVRRYEIDTSHWLGQSYLRGKANPFGRRTPLDHILVENSPYANLGRLKLRLIAAGLLTNACSICGITNWRGQLLSLHLDHINGVGDDHRLTNLRLLCPNCHSQTETYCGRNKGSTKHGRRQEEEV